MRATLAVAAAILIAGAAYAAQKLTPKEIQTEFFDGKPFTAATTSGTKFKMTFATDGKVMREPQDKAGQKGEGTWKLSKEGFCTSWTGEVIDLLHAGQCRQEQVVGGEGRDHRGGVEQVARARLVARTEPGSALRVDRQIPDRRRLA